MQKTTGITWFARAFNKLILNRLAHLNDYVDLSLNYFLVFACTHHSTFRRPPYHEQQHCKFIIDVTHVASGMILLSLGNIMRWRRRVTGGDQYIILIFYEEICFNCVRFAVHFAWDKVTFLMIILRKIWWTHFVVAFFAICFKLLSFIKHTAVKK